MSTSLKQMLEAAYAVVPNIAPAEAKALMEKGNALVVDVRDAPEVEMSGKIAGAVNISRGMLEFFADPESPYHDPRFSTDRTILVYCTFGARSALCGKMLKEMGYAEVYNLGSFDDWALQDGVVERA